MGRMNLNEPFDILDHNKTVRSDIYQIINGAAATIYTKVLQEKHNKKFTWITKTWRIHRVKRKLLGIKNAFSEQYRR